MDTVLHKKPITISVNTLRTLIQSFKEYAKKPAFSDKEPIQYEESQTAVDLITGALQQITIGKDELKSLVTQMKQDYASLPSKEERHNFAQQLENIEKETQFNEVLGTATEMVYMLNTRLTEVKSNRNRLGRKLGIPNPPESYETNLIGGNREKSIPQALNKDKLIERHAEICDNSEWLSENSQSSSDQYQSTDSVTSCNAIKPPTLMLPKFYGNEEDFPEFWAIYETLVHKSTTLSVVEKMLLLKDSLKGKSDSAIKGIQLIPQNYNWMVEALKKKYGNKPTNRARIVQRLTFLQPANKTAESCTYVFDKITMLINQMVSAGQDIRKTKDAMWTETILQKFPYDIIKNVLIAIKGKEEANIEDVMEEIEKEISAKTYVQSRIKVHQKKFPEQAPESERKHIPNTSSVCAFCDTTGHYATQCRTVTDIQARRNVVMEKRLCWKCYASTHSSKDCTRPNCHACGRMHHFSLCFANKQQGSKNTSTMQPAFRN
ncbi:hypothetical protein Aduo_016027 [Ancylostoma duodenale]